MSDYIILQQLPTFFNSIFPPFCFFVVDHPINQFTRNKSIFINDAIFFHYMQGVRPGRLEPGTRTRGVGDKQSHVHALLLFHLPIPTSWFAVVVALLFVFLKVSIHSNATLLVPVKNSLSSEKYSHIFMPRESAVIFAEAVQNVLLFEAALVIH